jgi:DNA-binding response OmpR family regulator
MGTNHSILIIDDEPNLSRSLGLILQHAGYVIKTAGTAKEALHMLQAGAYDLVFLDIKLPDQSGIQLLPQIKGLYPNMPVLILTAHATLDTAIEAVRAGARDYLLKPIDPGSILTLVSKILDEEKTPQRRREITGLIQELLDELRVIEGEEDQATEHASSILADDPARYLKRGILVLDLHTRSVLLPARNVSLPPSTFEYLVTLVRHSPDPVTYERLVTESQAYQNLSRSEAREITRWQIHEIRQAIESDPRHPQLVITVRDVGYRLIA